MDLLEKTINGYPSMFNCYFIFLVHTKLEDVPLVVFRKPPLKMMEPVLFECKIFSYTITHAIALTGKRCVMCN